jgi:hypothetical protein
MFHAYKSVTLTFNRSIVEGLFSVVLYLVFCLEKASPPPSNIWLVKARASET